MRCKRVYVSVSLSVSVGMGIQASCVAGGSIVLEVDRWLNNN